MLIDSHPLAALPRKPATARHVARMLVWPRWNAAVAFQEGSRRCRHLGAALIRGAVPLLRARVKREHQEARALVEVLDLSAQDRDLERRWLEAVDRLRILFNASPVGTLRERALLLDVARDPSLVAAMRVAAEARGVRPDPTWLAVFLAEGSPASVAIFERARREQGQQHPEVYRELEWFRGALREAAPRTAGSATAPPSPSGRGMTVEEFWKVVDAASGAGDPAEAVRDQLERLSPRQVAAFHRHLAAMLRKAYRWDLWGAAYLMAGGCSDDGFRDFRAALVASGRSAFERALEDPDTLAELGDLQGDEAFAEIAQDGYEALGRGELPAARPERRPAGRRWDFDDAEEQRRRHPRLWRIHATGSG
jgi:hypothetical protein